VIPLPSDSELSELRAQLHAFLRDVPEGTSEHLLLKELARRSEGLFTGVALDDHLGLFQAHFILFHALYGLREELLRRRLGVLQVHCLRIVLEPYAEASPGLEPYDPLQRYYTDLSHFRTTREEIEQMLAAFWRRFDGTAAREEALAVLGLSPDVDAATVRRRYRQLALAHHPDRGGDAAEMSRVNAAMATLRCCQE